MFGKKSSPNPNAREIDFRPLQKKDVKRVVKIIHEHDEDDAKEAAKKYKDLRNGHDFVLEINGEVVGITGASEDFGSDQTWWLSWSYLDPAVQGRGHGKELFAGILQFLKDNNARKVFVSTSNYAEKDGSLHYGTAIHLYRALGFGIEVEKRDFYATGENQLIFGLELTPRPETAGIAPPPPGDTWEDLPIILPEKAETLAETDRAHVIHWNYAADPQAESFSLAELQNFIDHARKKGARHLHISFPSTLLYRLEHTLSQAHFQRIGTLRDYYEWGVDDVHFCLQL